MDSVDAHGFIVKSHSKNNSQITGIKSIAQTENQATDDKKKISTRKMRHIGEFFFMRVFLKIVSLSFMKFVNLNNRKQGIFTCLYILVVPYLVHVKEST